jgi:hypothetical protein
MGVVATACVDTQSRYTFILLFLHLRDALFLTIRLFDRTPRKTYIASSWFNSYKILSNRRAVIPFALPGELDRQCPYYSPCTEHLKALLIYATCLTNLTQNKNFSLKVCSLSK